MFTGAARKALSVPFMASMTGRYQLLTNSLLSREYLREYKNFVYACVQARSEEIGNIQLKLMKGDVEVESSPLLDLINKVNPTMTKHELFTATQAFKDLDGNAFWYLARDNDGKGDILEIYPLRPDKVQIVPSKDNPLQVDGYIFTQPDGQKIPFAPQEILHFKAFNPLGYHPFPHRGMGVVEAAAWAIDTDNEARTWNYNFFKNSARPDGILTTAGDSAMSPEEYQRLQEEWNAKHNSSDNAHKVAVLGGGMTWTEIARSQKDMDFYQQRLFNRDEILSMFRVPKSIIGITDDVNRANADAAIYVFALRTVKPLMQQIVDTLNEFLVAEFGEDLQLVFESPVAEDRKQSLDEYSQGIANGYLSINEVREAEGLEPVEGGDDLYLPLNMSPVANTTGDIDETDAETQKGKKRIAKKKVASTKKTAKKEDKKAKSAAELAVEKLIESRKSKTRLPKAKHTHDARQLTKEAIDNYIVQYRAHLHISREPLVKAMHAFFDAQHKEVLKNLRNQMKFYTVKEIIENKDLLNSLFDEDAAQSASVSLITPFIRDYIKQSGNNAANLIGGDFDPEVQTLNDFVTSRAQYFAESINGTTSEDLLTSIKTGLDLGEGLSDIEQRVADVYGIATGSRTQMIARTEISAASNQGAKSAYQQSGIEQWQWAVVNPEDEDCKENDGEVVTIGDAFPDGDIEPPVHPNCECTTIPVF